MSSAVFQYIIEADSVRQVELQLEVCRYLQEDWSNRDEARREKLDDLGDALLHALNEILCGSSNYRQLIPATPALHVNRTIVLRLTLSRTYWVVLQCTWNLFTLEGMGEFELAFDGKQKYKSPETVQCIRESLVANLQEALMAFTNSGVFSEVEHIKVMIKQIKGDMRQHFKNAAAGALVNSAVEAAKQVCDEAAGTGSRLCTRNAKGEEWTYIRTLETGNKYQVSRSSGKQTNAIVACIEWMKRNAPSFVENRPLYLGRSERIKFFKSLQEVASSPVDDICRLEMLRLSNHVAEKLKSGEYAKDHSIQERLADLVLIGLSKNGQYVSAIAPNYRKTVERPPKAKSTQKEPTPPVEMEPVAGPSCSISSDTSSAPPETTRRQRKTRVTVGSPTASAPLGCNVTRVCTYLDEALGTMMQMVLPKMSVEEFMVGNNLRERHARGDGYCLLYSWAEATNVSFDTIKTTIVNELTVNSARYLDGAIDPAEIMDYLETGNYTMEAVDAVVDILCNATGITVFIIGQRFDYAVPGDAEPVFDEMEIRRISPAPDRITPTQPILLLKTADHYDSLV